MDFSAVAHAYARFPVVLRLFLIVSSLIITFGIVIHYIEPETFPTIFEGVWWAIVTASTVGYGDYTPVTPVGRILGFIVIMFGIGIVSFFVTTLASSTITTRNALKNGELDFKKQSHYIVIGWNERSKQVITQLQLLQPNKNIVLIDQTLRQCPINNSHLHFIKGNPLEDKTMKRANASEAHTVIITANHGYEAEADSKSIITLLTIKGLNPHIYSIVEILTPEQKNNCLRAGADEIIETSFISGLAMVNSTLYNGIINVIYELLDHKNNHMLLYERVPNAYFQKSFHEAHLQYQQKNMLIIGIRREENIKLHPSANLILVEGDEFIVIKQ